MAGSPTGNAITNEIAYIANMLGKGRMPYGGNAVGNYLQQLSNPWQRRPTPPRTAQETGIYGRYIPGEQQQPFGGTPQERAQAAETSRVAQLTAQDPELQRYEAARLKAVAPGATAQQVQSAEDIGMQIWRQKYQGTPMASQGGAVGSFNPLMERTFGYQAGMAPAQMVEMQKTAAPIPVAPGAIPYQMGDLGTRATLTTGYDPAAYGLTPEKIEEMKQKLLQQAK